MYWLIGKINPFIDKLNNNSNSQEFLKEFESLDANIYYQHHSGNKLNNYDISNSSSVNELSSLNDDLTLLPQTKKYYLSSSKNFIDKSKKPIKGDHSLTYTRLIKSFDIIGMIIIIFTVALNIGQNEEYYAINKPARVVGVLLLNYIHEYPENNTWNGLIQSDFNISNSLFNYVNNIPIEVHIANYANNFLKTGQGYYSDITNEDIVLAYNLTPLTYEYQDNLTYEHLNFTIPLKEDANISQYKKLILILSAFSAALSFLSYYLSYLLKKENFQIKVPFYRTKYLYLAILDIVIFSFNPYPGFTSSFFQIYSEKIVCFPVSIYFSMLVNFRVFFLVKLLKFSSWNSDSVGARCAKYQTSHSFLFVYKCFEANHPFSLIFIIVSSFALVFGINIRLSEIYYWDLETLQFQNWNYYFNSLWFIITTMLGLGYGDFYPKTHVGRFLNIFVCITGIYVVTMLMVNLSKISVLNNNEEKVYTLIKRLNLKTMIKEEQSKLIFYYIRYTVLKRTKKKENHFIYYNRRLMFKCISRKVTLQREMKKYDFVPNQEIIMDLIEKLEGDIKEIDKEVTILQKINNSVTEFLKSQRKMMNNLKQSVVTTNQMFNLIDKTAHTFGTLHNYDRKVLIEEFGLNYTSNKALHNYFENIKTDDVSIVAERRRTNPNQFENLIIRHDHTQCQGDEDNDNSNIQIDNSYKTTQNCPLGNYQVTNEEFTGHFQNLFFDQISQARSNRFLKYHSLKKNHHKKLLTDQIFKKVKNDEGTGSGILGEKDLKK